MQTNTYREILQQPSVWLKEYKYIQNFRNEIEMFVEKFITSESDIILTGAGTSAFIGDVLEVVLNKKGYHNCRAVSTTDLITHASSLLDPNRPTVLISFARSGNSPESVGAVRLANTICSEIAHVYITCNANGELAKMSDSDNSLLVLLPEETNDISLAMTSSFSTMMLACLLIFDVKQLEAKLPAVQAAAHNAQVVMDRYQLEIKEIAERKFARGVFLGSGELKGIAEECHLKLQELTDGDVVCKFDSFLGFRHGPKAVINEETALVYLLSDDAKVLRYETDLIEQINSNNQLIAQIAVTCGEKVNIEGAELDLEIVMPHLSAETKEYGCIPYVLVGQLLGFYKSEALGLCPDSPSVSGNIARVVEGVTIYE